jgi:hypothetical protein
MSFILLKQLLQPLVIEQIQQQPLVSVQIQQPVVIGQIPNHIIIPNKEQIDINIIRDNDGNDKLSDNDIHKLKHRLNFLRDIYNIILNQLCIHKQKPIIINDLIDDIITDLNKNQMTHNYLKEFCLSNTNIHGPRNQNNDCVDPMFSKENLLIPITEMVKDQFINKACTIKARGNYEFNFDISGGVNFGIDENIVATNEVKYELINLNKLLNENIQSIEKNTLLCIQNTYITKKIPCNFCKNWVNDRNKFRNIINNFLYSKNIDNILDVIKSSSSLLPAVIFDQNEYHYFFTAIEQFKLSKNIS